MGLFGSIKKAFKKVVKTAVNVATGGYYGSREQRKATGAAKRQAAAEQARQEELSSQEANRNRQESADLGALNDDMAGPGDETAGVLTGPGGLVEDRKLSGKKKLGGGK